MFCPNCGASLLDRAVFCPNCGMRLDVPRNDVGPSGVEGGNERPASGERGAVWRESLDPSDFERSGDLDGEVAGHPDDSDLLGPGVLGADDLAGNAIDAGGYTASSDGHQGVTAATKGMEATVKTKEPSKFMWLIKTVASLAVAGAIGRLIGASCANMTLQSRYGNGVSETSRTGSLALPTETSSAGSDNSSTQPDTASDPLSSQTSASQGGEVVVNAEAGRYSVDVTIPSGWIELSDEMLSGAEVSVDNAENGEIRYWEDPLQGGNVILQLIRMEMPFRQSAEGWKSYFENKDAIASYLNSLDNPEVISEIDVEFSGYPGKRLEYKGEVAGTTVRGQLLIAMMPTTITAMIGMMPESLYSECGPTISEILDSAHTIEW